MEREKIFIHLCVIVLVGYVVYVPTLAYQLTYLDDNVLIGRAAADITAVSGGLYWRPAVALSYTLNAAAGGTNLLGYHIVNVLVHVGVGIALYLLLSELAYDKGLALFLTLVFLVHPVTAQAVAWIPGRNELLLALFWVISFVFFFKWLKRPNQWGWLLGHLGAYALALLSKETAVGIPVMGLMGVIGPMRLMRPMGRMRLIGLMGGWVLVTAAWVVLREHAINPINLIRPIGLMGLMGLIGEIGKLILPVQLSTYPIVQDMAWGIGFIGFMGLIGLIGLMRHMRLIGQIGLMGWWVLWLGLTLAATVVRPNIAQPGVEFLEHRLYVPLIGLIGLIGQISQIRPMRLMRPIRLMGLIGLMGLTIVNSRYYRDGFHYWTRAVQTSPHSAFAHNQLGVMYYFMKKFDEAKQQYQDALAGNPNEPLAHNNLGVIFLDQGRLDEAKGEFERELAVNPGYPNALANLELLKKRVQ